MSQAVQIYDPAQRIADLEAALAARDVQLAAAHREIDTFVNAASHDLRAPLRILTGFTEALQDELGDSIHGEAASFLAEILKASERMEGLIDGLLSLSRCAHAEIHHEKLDMSTLAELVFYELRHGKNSREVDCQVEPGLEAYGDVRLVTTLLRNLIGNAWKFSSRVERPAIRVSGARRDGMNWFVVEDNGAGFDMAQADRLWKPFTRLHRQDEFPGHGIGLATAHRIVTRHGGEVSAQGMPDAGAIFEFSLPPPPA
jgi:signal transduction histidine kinase